MLLKVDFLEKLDNSEQKKNRTRSWFSKKRIYVTLYPRVAPLRVIEHWYMPLRVSANDPRLRSGRLLPSSLASLAPNTGTPSGDWTLVYAPAGERKRPSLALGPFASIFARSARSEYGHPYGWSNTLAPAALVYASRRCAPAAGAARLRQRQKNSDFFFLIFWENGRGWKVADFRGGPTVENFQKKNVAKSWFSRQIRQFWTKKKSY